MYFSDYNNSLNHNNNPYFYYQTAQPQPPQLQQQQQPYYYMMNTNPQQINEQQTQPHYSGNRVVEIPVLHYPNTNGVAATASSPPQTSSFKPSYVSPNTNYQQQQPHYSSIPQQPSQHHYHPHQRATLFDDFNTPFDFIDNRQRSLFDEPLNVQTDDFFQYPPPFQRVLDRQKSPFRNIHRQPPQHYSPQQQSNNEYYTPPTNNSPKTAHKSFTPNQTAKETQIPVNYIPSANSQHNPLQQHHHHHQQHQNSDSNSGSPTSRFPRTSNNTDSSHSSSLSPPKTSATATKANSRQQSPAPPIVIAESKLHPERSPSPKAKSMGSAQPKYDNKPPPSQQQRTQQQQQQQSDFVRLATEAAQMSQQETSRSTTPVRTVKTSQDKIDEINQKLNDLDRDVNAYTNGTNKRDKEFLKLEEYLTRCLLNLDEIERGEERINDQRKKLINLTHRIIDRLESKLEPNDQQQQQQENMQQTSENILTDDSDEHQINDEKVV